jgi:hypothetical protein
VSGLGQKMPHCLGERFFFEDVAGLFGEAKHGQLFAAGPRKASVNEEQTRQIVCRGCVALLPGLPRRRACAAGSSRAGDPAIIAREMNVGRQRLPRGNEGIGPQTTLY